VTNGNKSAIVTRREIEAIKLYREETGAGLLECKEAVEAYIEGL
jgi:ribosomal protein L7/L12